VREIRMLRAMWQVLETKSRKLLTGHEDGNVGYRQGVSCGLARRHSTLLGKVSKRLLQVLVNLSGFHDE
jgi:hypothetical protein